MIQSPAIYVCLRADAPHGPAQPVLLRARQIFLRRRHPRRQSEMCTTLNRLARGVHGARYGISLKDIEFLTAVPASARQAREATGEQLHEQFARFLAEPAHVTALRNAAAACPPDPLAALVLQDALGEMGEYQ